MVRPDVDGIFEEIDFSRLERLDPVASAELGFDVVYAVQTGRDLIDAQEDGCLTGYVPPPWTVRELAGVAFWLVLAIAVFGGCIVLAAGWLL